MTAKQKAAAIAAGVAGAVVIGGCAAAGFLKRSEDNGCRRIFGRGNDGGEFRFAVHAGPAPEDACHES